MKIAIVVEGIGELLFVRHLLLKFDDNVDISCFLLEKEENFNNSSLKQYMVKKAEPSIYYEIICAGNDERVSKAIINRQVYFKTSGFDKVIALRDIFSEKYKKKSNKVDVQEIEKFKKIMVDSLKTTHFDKKNIFFCFAVMEFEAWLLGMYECLLRLDSRITLESIREKIKCNLSTVDPETNFVHPKNKLALIYSLIQSDYGDKKYVCSMEQMKLILKKVQKEDLLKLFKDRKCNSFNIFLENLVKIK